MRPWRLLVAYRPKGANELARGAGIAVGYTEDSSAFNDLAAYDAVVLLHNTGDVLTDGELTALDSYVRQGHGVAAIGAAAEAEPGSSTWEGELSPRVGAPVRRPA